MRRSILTKLTVEELAPNSEIVNNGAEPVVQFTGPLGAEITKALQVEYDKSTLVNAGKDGDVGNDGATGGDPLLGKQAAITETAPNEGATAGPQGFALESQANDALGAGLGSQVVPAGDAEPDTIAYVVDENTLDMPTVIDAANAMDKADEDKDFILIIDGTTDPENGLEGVPQEKRVELVSALEGFAKAADVPVFRSVKAFLEREV